MLMMMTAKNKGEEKKEVAQTEEEEWLKKKKIKIFTSLNEYLFIQFLFLRWRFLWYSDIAPSMLSNLGAALSLCHNCADDTVSVFK